MAKFRVHEIQSKSIINPVKGMPFRWSINPYRGCRHACVYCYARPTHEFLGLNGADEFQEVIFAKMNAPQLVRDELARRSWRRECVVIGTATDPYQQAESKYRLTRGILEAFRDAGSPVAITTKSPMVMRDLDILKEIAERADVSVAVTVTTLDERLWRELEPTTAKPGKRLETVRALAEAGIRAGVFVSPILPGLTDDPGHMETVVAAAAASAAQFVSGSALRLGPGISEYYLPFIERTYPHLTKQYELLYRSNYAPKYYSDVIDCRLTQLRAKYGLTEGRIREPAEEPPLRFSSRQLPLFQNVA